MEIKKDLKLFKSDIEFSEFIELLASERKASVLETTLSFCDENGVEPEQLKTMISQSLRDKLRENFRERGMLKAESSLDSFFA